VPETIAPRASYDRIAHLYDVDMGRNMSFDDVALYANLAGRAAGPVLELGCGNGRILLELLARGVDAVGADCSPRMLAELDHKALARGLAATTCLMDARSLGFAAAFRLVLCPYSLITYMTDDYGAPASLLHRGAPGRRGLGMDARIRAERRPMPTSASTIGASTRTPC
jgi:SAM-dependent methyltransferase